MGALPVAAAITLAALILALPLSQAAAATSVAPNSVSIVSDPGVTLTAPADTRG